MKERVLMHKETGELYLKTNLMGGDKIAAFWFLVFKGQYYTSWYDDNYIELGFL